MASIPKKIFNPLHYKFPRNDVDIKKFEFSKYKDHLNFMMDSTNSDFSQYYLAKICPDIAFHNLLEEMEKENTIEIFVTLFINSLPDIISISPANILESIVDLKIIQQSKKFSSSLKLSILCCRLSTECSFAVLTIILKEAFNQIKDSESHIVASFLQKILISFSYLSDKSDELIIESDTKDKMSFIPPFFEEFNKFLSQVFEYHVQVLSLRTISYMMQEFINHLDTMAPSPQYFIQNPERCSINSAITISLILGQVFNALSDLSENAKKVLISLFLLSPVQVRDAIIYQIEKSPNKNSNDDFIIGLISYNNPEFMPKWKESNMSNSVYLNNKTYHFTTHFDQIMNDSQLVLEISHFFHFIESNSIETEIDPLGIVAITSKITNIFPILLGKLEYDKFIFLSYALCSLSKILMNLFGRSNYVKFPILYYLDVLLVSPFSTMPEHLTYPVEIVEKHIKSIDSIILDEFEDWFEFVFDQQQQQPQKQQHQQLPMFANLHILSLIIHEKNDLTSTFNMIKEKEQIIIRQSAILLQTLSFKALNEVSERWIEIVSFFTLFDLDEAARFTYITLRLLFNCLSSFHESMNEEGSCYILQLLERLIVCPLYHFTICAYESMISTILNCAFSEEKESKENHEEDEEEKEKRKVDKDENIVNNLPSEIFQSIHFISKIFEKNGTNYEVSAMFGLPNYPTILKIARICVNCLNKNEYVETSNIAAALLSRILENKYCRSIIQNIIKDAPEGYYFDVVEESTSLTVLELQSRIDEIVPNRIKKIELGFQMWNQGFDNGTPTDILIRFARKTILDS